MQLKSMPALLSAAFLLCINLSFSVFALNNTHAKSIHDIGLLSFKEVPVPERFMIGITSFHQDKKGFIWFGTQSGLVRYDGYRFITHQYDENNSNSLSGNFINVIWGDAQGDLWIATESNGVTHYVQSENQYIRYKHDRDNINSISHDSIYSLAGDEFGNVYVGTADGLSIVDPKTGNVTRIEKIWGCDKAFESSVIYSLLVEDNNYLWIGTTNGLCRVPLSALAENSLEEDEQPTNGVEVAEFVDKAVARLFLAADGKIWIGTENSGAAYLTADRDNVVFIPYEAGQQGSLSNPFIVSIIQPTKKEIWLGTYGGGINVIDADTGAVTRHIRHDPAIRTSISQDMIGSLLVDKSGLVWVGSWAAGMSIYNPKNAVFSRLRHSPYNDKSISNKGVETVLWTANNEIWLGHFEGSIDIFRPETGIINNFNPKSGGELLANTTVLAMEQSKDEVIWLGTASNGLFYYDPAQQGVAAVERKDFIGNRSVVKLLETPAGLWVGTNSGIFSIDVSSRAPQSLKHIENIDLLERKIISTLTYDNNGYLWIGTMSGLFVLSKDGNSLTEISATAGTALTLKDNQIRYAFLDEKKRLVVETANGIYRLTSWNESAAIFENINSSLELEQHKILGPFAADGSGRFWSYMGWIDPQEQNYQVLEESDGSDAGVCWYDAAAQIKDGTMLFGCTDGLLMIKPELWQDWDFRPPTVITDVQLDNGSVDYKDELILPAGTQSFSVEFSALDFSAPDMNKYAYMLDGYDQVWIETDAKNRRVSYTNLAPGNYIFRVKGTNRKGVWGEQQATLNVTQIPTWYETPSFKLALILLSILAIYGVVHWRVRAIEKQKIALDKLVELRTQELAEANIALTRSYKKLERVSHTDQLTGVYNRRYFEHSIQQEINMLERAFRKNEDITNKVMGFILIDADHFKQVNDVHGHLAGDQVLVKLAKILKKVCRNEDWIVRWGGEEFLVACRATRMDELAALAERIRVAVESHKFKIGDGKTITQTCSMGLCNYPFIAGDFDAFSREQIIHIADSALYLAKENGRNAWVSIAYTRHSIKEQDKKQIMDDLEGAASAGLVAASSSNPTLFD